MKSKRFLGILLLMLMCLLAAVPAQAATSNAGASKVKNGWVENKYGKKYYRNGVMLTGQRKVGTNYYYFSKNGYMKTGWRKINDNYYYYKKNGAAVSGPFKSSKGNYFYFGKYGKRLTDTSVTKDGVTYYIDANGYMDGKKKNGKYYYPNGKAMNAVKTEEYKTLLTARSVVKKVTTKSMTKAQKLEKCFAWVMKFPYVTRRRYTLAPGWTALYANDHFKLGGGNCQADACTFAYLAKAIGYEEVYVCCDSAGTNAHSWAEVNGLVYDPLFAQAKNYSTNYAARYGVYILHPIVHQKIEI